MGKIISKFFIKIRQIILHNLFLKIISLVVAVVLWLYVGSEAIKGIKV